MRRATREELKPLLRWYYAGALWGLIAAALVFFPLQDDRQTYGWVVGTAGGVFGAYMIFLRLVVHPRYGFSPWITKMKR